MPKSTQQYSGFNRLKPVIEIVKACVWTGALADENPVSVMLIAEQESCKTEVLKHFYGTPTIQYQSDVTSKGVATFKRDIMEHRLKHLCLLDLVKILAHGKGVSERTLQTLSTLMEEGESGTSDGGGRENWSTEENPWPRIGVMMAITTSFFNGKAGHWRKTGFMSRFLPVSFEYKEETVATIHESIRKGLSLPPPEKQLWSLHPLAKVEIKTPHQRIVELEARALGNKMDTYGFRYHKILRSLIKASAAMELRRVTIDKDAENITKWARYFAMERIEL